MSKTYLYSVFLLFTFSFSFSQTTNNSIDTKNKQAWDSIGSNKEFALKQSYLNLESSKKTNYKKGLSHAYLNIGAINIESGDYKIALNNIQSALNLFTTENDKVGLAKCYNQLGRLYLEKNETEKALEYLNKSIALNTGDPYGDDLASNYINLGIYYFDIILPDSSEKYYSKALKIFERNKNIEGQILSLNNIATIKSMTGDFLKERELYYQILDKIPDNSGLIQKKINVLVNLSSNLLSDNKLTESFSELEKAKNLSQKINYKSGLQEIYFRQSQYFKKKNDFKQAYETYRLFKSYSDSLIDNQLSNQLSRFEITSKFEEKMRVDSIKQMKDLEKRDVEIQNQNLQIKKDRIIRWFFIAIFIFLIVVFYLIYKAYRSKSRSEKIIREQKHLVDEKQKEILDSIRYAKRIQTALITPEKYIDKNLNKLQEDK